MKKILNHATPSCKANRNDQVRLKNLLVRMLVGICLISTPSFISAQDEVSARSPEESARFQTEWMKSNLVLDSTVIPLVYSINLKYARKNQSILQSGAAKVQKYKELKSSSEAKDQEMKKVLTPEQFQIYLQKKEEMKKKIRERYQERKER